jgi:hypothetical protein
MDIKQYKGAAMKQILLLYGEKLTLAPFGRELLVIAYKPGVTVEDFVDNSANLMGWIKLDKK